MEKIKKGNRLFSTLLSEECLADQYLWKTKKDAEEKAEEEINDQIDATPVYVIEVQVMRIIKFTPNSISKEEVETLTVDSDC